MVCPTCFNSAHRWQDLHDALLREMSKVRAARTVCYCAVKIAMPVCNHVCMCVSVEWSWKLTCLQKDKLDGQGPELERDLLFTVGSFVVF